MACLFAARLSQAGIPVTLLGTWREGLDALQSHGVRLIDEDGLEHAFPVQVAAAASDCTGSRFALVLVKAWQTEHAARQLAACLAPDGLALTLQNGLGNRETLEQALGPGHVAFGVTTMGATLLGPGQVRPGGEGKVSLGAHPGLAALADLLQLAEMDVEYAPNVDDLLWSKLVVNAAINPLTGLLRVPNGALLKLEPARALLGAVAIETASVAKALGRHLAYPDPVAAVEAVAVRTATNKSSMLQDLLRGAPTEIDAINGAIVSVGDECGIATPMNRMLWLLIRAHAMRGKSG
jgi:2-dehydropantoate 2-reductase